MLVHWIFIYNWPSSIIKVIERWMVNFIWSGNLEEKNNIVTVSWKTCYKSLKEGGLGLKPLKIFNVSSNMHICWKFFQAQDSGSSLLASKVKRNNKFIKYSIKYSIWSNIKDSFAIVKENTQLLNGNGNSVQFWLYG